MLARDLDPTVLTKLVLFLEFFILITAETAKTFKIVYQQHFFPITVRGRGGGCKNVSPDFELKFMYQLKIGVQ